jgi:hypothetical protein
MEKRMVTRWISMVVTGAILVLLVVSCLPDPIPLSLEQAKPQIVVSTQIVPDEGLVVLLTKTFSALDFNDESDPEDVLAAIALDDATVILSGPGRTDTLLTLGVGLYGGIAIPLKSGDAYTLDVTSKSLGKVTATTTVLPQVSFDSIGVELYLNGYGDSLAQVTHGFTDPVGKNWYMLNVQRIKRPELVENILNPAMYTRLLTDSDFEGRQYGESFRAFPRNYGIGDTVMVALANISEDYYKFQDMRSDNRFSFVEYLSEPVNYHTNVEGGRGFFNLYIPDIRFFVLRQMAEPSEY